MAGRTATPSPSASNTLTLTLPRPHSAQRRILSEARRFNAVDCGRRFGKTTLAIELLVRPALAGQPVAYFAPTYKMLAEVWREIGHVLRPVTSRPNAQEHRLELLTGGVVDMWSLDSPDIARGRKYARVVVDEAAMIRDLDEAWQAVIRPTLSDLRGDAWFFSTPKGRNFFWRLYQQGLDPEQPDWACWQMPTAANPYIAADEIASARVDLPERTFSQEYLAAFLEDGGGVFRNVTGCATLPGLVQPDPEKPRQTVCGIDWGKSEDFTVISVVDAATGELVDFDRFNQIDWHVQRQRVTTMYERWHWTSGYAEYNSIGGPNLEQLQREGIPLQPFTTTNATKAQVIESLALALENSRVHYPNLPVLVGELQAYDLDRLPSGLIRYGAPSGMHDDCVISLALAWHAADRGRVTIGPSLWD